MRRAGFGARAAIAWLRVARPGSVIGPQQAYLCACERRGWAAGNALGPASVAQPQPQPAAPDGPGASWDAGRSGGRERPRGPGPGSESAAGAALAAGLAAQVTAAMCARGAGLVLGDGGREPTWPRPATTRLRDYCPPAGRPDDLREQGPLPFGPPARGPVARGLLEHGPLLHGPPTGGPPHGSPAHVARFAGRGTLPAGISLLD